MPSNLKIEDELLNEALSLGGLKTKKATVNEALRTFIRHQKQLKILGHESAFSEFDTYDYKKYRRGR